MEDHIKQTVHERYKTIELALSPEDKKTAIARLAARRLDANRKEVAAIRALRAEGHKLHLRVGLAPQAILGVEDPPTKRR